MAISSNTTGLRPGVCTSTTRPTSPYEGQSIYQTDTDTVLFWDGTAWVAPYATTAALNLKANIANPTFTGTLNANSYLIIDSSGRVTTPSQPSFSAYPAANYGLAGVNILYHNTTLFNTGSHFNTSNYRFTAPVAGVYHFSLNLNVYNMETGSYFMPALYKNGAGFHYGDRKFGSGATDTNSNLSISMYLVASDYVQAYCVSDDGSYNMSGGNIWNSLSGVLLG